MKYKITHYLLPICLIALPLAQAKSHSTIEKEPSSYAHFNGFYAGGALGSTFSSSNKILNNLLQADVDGSGFGVQPISLDVPIRGQVDADKKSIAGSLFIGYGRTWQRLYLGGELSVSGADYNMSNSLDSGASLDIAGLPIQLANINITTQTRINPVQFAFAFRPGVLLTPSTLLYGRVGGTVAKTSFRDKMNIVFLGVHGRGTETDQKSSAFLQLGGGLEQSVSQHWTFRVDYVYSFYGKLQAANTFFAGYSNLLPIDAIVNTSNQVKLDSQSVMFGATYQFNKWV